MKKFYKKYTNKRGITKNGDIRIFITFQTTLFLFLCYFFHVRYSGFDLIFIQEQFSNPFLIEENFFIFEFWRIFIILFFTHKIPSWFCGVYKFIGEIGVKTRMLKMVTLFFYLLVSLIVFNLLIFYNIDGSIGNDFGLLFNDLCLFIIPTFIGLINLFIIGVFVWIKNGYVKDN